MLSTSLFVSWLFIHILGVGWAGVQGMEEETAQLPFPVNTQMSIQNGAANVVFLC